MTHFSPREIVSELDRYIVGQNDAKRAVAIARGADPESLVVLSKSDVPLSYLPGNNLSISVTVVGDLKLEAK